MDILLISNEDTCRSRIAQELLHAFGRGMNISTAGIMEGNCVPDAVCNVMEQNGFSVSRKKPSGVGTYTDRSWDYVISLCKEAGEELKFITLDAKQQAHFDFEDPFKNVRYSDAIHFLLPTYFKINTKLFDNSNSFWLRRILSIVVLSQEGSQRVIVCAEFIFSFLQ